MTWALIWTALAVLALVTLAATCWWVWHRLRALLSELGRQSARPAEFARLASQVELPQNLTS